MSQNHGGCGPLRLPKTLEVKCAKPVPCEKVLAMSKRENCHTKWGAIQMRKFPDDPCNELRTVDNWSDYRVWDEWRFATAAEEVSLAPDVSTLERHVLESRNVLSGVLRSLCIICIGALLCRALPGVRIVLS